MQGTIAVGASVAQKAGYGGHTWVLLQYLLGLRRLGWEVLLLDRLDADMAGGGADYLVAVMERFGLSDSYSLMDDRGQVLAGVPRRRALARLGRAAALINVMGFIRDPELLAAVPRRVFLDIDPGLGQMWCELGLHDPFQGHDDFVTVGQSIGTAECPVPTCGREWIATVPPVVLGEWPFLPRSGHAVTSVVSWRGLSGVVEYRGRLYGHRVHEFRRFLELPAMCRHPFELALRIDPGDEADRVALADAGWRLADPRAVAGDPDSYRAYIQGSAAELMVAKSLYTSSQCGWVSDRSVCYLAAGRPVVAQDTGIGDLYPTGRGLVVFTTLEEAAAGVEEVFGDYRRHAEAARELAEEHFGSDRVLGRLLEAVRLG